MPCGSDDEMTWCPEHSAHFIDDIHGCCCDGRRGQPTLRVSSYSHLFTSCLSRQPCLPRVGRQDGVGHTPQHLSATTVGRTQARSPTQNGQRLAHLKSAERAVCPGYALSLPWSQPQESGLLLGSSPPPPTPLYYFKVWPPVLSPDQMRFN